MEDYSYYFFPCIVIVCQFKLVTTKHFKVSTYCIIFNQFKLLGKCMFNRLR